jgi:hypothetical protein
MNALQQSIDQLYTAFADVPKPRSIEGCPCCIEGKEVDKLLATSLREIQPDTLSSYASSAFLTVGSVADYLYLLPRILEISATDDNWWPDVEVTGRAIRSSAPDSWPSSRRSALERMFAAVIKEAVETGEYFKLDGWVCAIARSGFDVAQHLQQIATTPAAVLAYFEDNAAFLPERRLCNPFWELPCAAHDAIVSWFYSEKIRRIPFDAYGYTLKSSG